MKHLANLIRLSLITSLLIVTSVGCQQKDRDMRKVVGKVTYNGNPVEEALVQFVPLDNSGLGASGQSDAQGNYALTSLQSQVPGSGTKPAKYKIVVTKFEQPEIDPVTAAFNAGDIDYAEYKQKVPQLKTEAVKHLLPQKYSNVVKSPLEFTVEDKKENEFNIELTD